MMNTVMTGRNSLALSLNRPGKRAKLFSLLLALVLALSSLGACVPARGESPVETLRMGCYPDPGMMNIDGETQEKSGYAYEYMQEIAVHTGWRYEYVYGSFSELMDKLATGEIDILPVVSATEERREQYLFPDYKMADEMFYLAALEEIPVSEDDHELNGLRVGSIEGYFQNIVFQEFMEEKGLNCELICYATSQEKYEAVEKGEIDLTIESSLLIQPVDLQSVCEISEVSPIYTAVSKSRPDLLKKLNEAQKELEEENPTFLSSLRVKYFKSIPLFKTLSQKDEAWIEERGVLRIGAFYIDDPLVYEDTNGVIRGVIPEYVEKMFANYGLDLPIEWHLYGANEEALAALRAGEIDVIHPYYSSYQLAEKEGVIISTTVYKSSMSLLYLGEFTEKTLRRVASPVTRLGVHYVQDNYPDSEIVPCQSGADCILKLLAGDADCVIMNTHGLNKLVDENSSAFRIKTINTLCNCSFAALPENAAAIDIINHVAPFLTEVDLNAIEAKYFVEYSSQVTLTQFLRKNPAYLLAMIAMLITIVLVVVLLRKKSAVARMEEKNRRQLADALSMAESANRAKTTFLNNMSHDIRTPLNAVIGYTGLAASHVDNKEQVRDYLSKISQSSVHLLSLINDVLDMSRIESGKMNLSEKPEDLSEVIHGLRNIIQADIHAKQLDFYVDAVGVRNEQILCDKLRLNQVLLNVLSNAIKYTPAGGTVILRIAETAVKENGYASYEFLVKDNGIGMSQEFISTIFDPFTRMESSTVSGVQGTGLGMAITKNIVDMMGGTIQVESELDKGTEVLLRFDFKLQEKQKAPLAIPELKELRGLVVDDDADTCLSVSEMLREIGMRAEWCTSGKEAVIRAAEGRRVGDLFRVYIIDWLMPDMNGIETTRRIRREIGDDTPIIILTSYDWSDIEEEAREAGVTAFVSKPMFPSDLNQVLCACLGKSEAAGKSESQPGHHFAGKKLLLVEDNEMNREIAVEILEESGFVMDTAEDGTIAVEKMSRAKPGDYDLILMDIQMPIMDGYEATRQIRAMTHGVQDIPILAMTANAFEEDKKAAFDAGMNEHIAKPIDVKALLATLMKFM